MGPCSQRNITLSICHQIHPLPLVAPRNPLRSFGDPSGAFNKSAIFARENQRPTTATEAAPQTDQGFATAVPLQCSSGPRPRRKEWRVVLAPLGQQLYISSHVGALCIQHLQQTKLTSFVHQRWLSNLARMYSGTGLSRVTNRAGFVWEVYPDLTPPRVLGQAL